MTRSRVSRLAAIASEFEHIGGGTPRAMLTPKQARQFIFPNGMILRFDLAPGQYSPQQGPHLNLEIPLGSNRHIYLRLRGRSRRRIPR